MKLTSFTKIIGAATFAVTSTRADLVGMDYYSKNFAPKQLARIHSYRVAKEHTLTLGQEGALDLMEDVVRAVATDKVDAAKSACVAAFGEQECLKISGVGGNVVSKRDKTPCNCATLDNYCGNECTLHTVTGCGYADGKFTANPGIALSIAGWN